jgi:hypothetical protein
MKPSLSERPDAASTPEMAPLLERLFRGDRSDEFSEWDVWSTGEYDVQRPGCDARQRLLRLGDRKIHYSVSPQPAGRYVGSSVEETTVLLAMSIASGVAAGNSASWINGILREFARQRVELAGALSRIALLERNREYPGLRATESVSPDVLSAARSVAAEASSATGLAVDWAVCDGVIVASVTSDQFERFNSVVFDVHRAVAKKVGSENFRKLSFDYEFADDE